MDYSLLLGIHFPEGGIWKDAQALDSEDEEEGNATETTTTTTAATTIDGVLVTPPAEEGDAGATASTHVSDTAHYPTRERSSSSVSSSSLSDDDASQGPSRPRRKSINDQDRAGEAPPRPGAARNARFLGRAQTSPNLSLRMSRGRSKGVDEIGHCLGRNWLEEGEVMSGLSHLVRACSM